MGSRFDDWKKTGATSGFMVAVKGAGAPDFVHDTQAAAVKEAKRLLDGLPDNKDQTAFILRLTGTVFRGKATRPAPEVATFPDELSVKFTTPAPVSVSALPEGFIPWAGGECPVAAGTLVSAIVGADRELVGPFQAHAGDAWRHNTTGHVADIIGYRVEKPADFKIEPGKFYITGTGERVGPMVQQDVHGDPGTWFVSGNDPHERLWSWNGTRLVDRGDHIVALAADQSPDLSAVSVGLTPGGLLSVSTPGTPKIKFAMDMGATEQAPDLKFLIHPATFPAPKFKPGDRVYYDSKLAPKGRVYGTVVPAERWPLFGKGALPDHDPVFALWETSPEVGFMPADRVFPDLRTIAGGGVLKLEAGRKGKTRDGKIVGPLVDMGPKWKNFPIRAPFGDEWGFVCRLDGFSRRPDTADPLDVIELLPEGA